MTIPFERTRALIQTKEFLQALLDPTETPRVPKALRDQAKRLLRHYPTYFDLEKAHRALPELYGPVPPFSRMTASAETQSVIAAVRQGPGD